MPGIAPKPAATATYASKDQLLVLQSTHRNERDCS